MKYVVILIFIITSTHDVFGQGVTLSESIIDTDQTWILSNSPYYITDNVLIQQGVTLTIEPGVVVKFSDDKFLKIDGNIIASGTSTQTIEFLSSTSTGTWEGIKIRPTSTTSLTIDLQNQNYTYQSGSVFSFVRFKNANKALYVFDTSIYVANSSFELCNYGIEIRATENVIIKDNTFSGIDRSNNTIGIYTHYEDNSSGDYVNEITNTVITGNIFTNNHLGLSLNMNQRVFEDFNVLNNIIKNNTTGIKFSGGGYGARVNGVIIKENKIFDNTQNGVSIGQIYGGSDFSNSDDVLLSFENNTVVDNPVLWDFGGGTSGVQISIKNNIIYNTRTDEYNYGIKFNGGTSQTDLIGNNLIYSKGILLTLSDSYTDPSNKTFKYNTLIQDSTDENLVDLFGSGHNLSNNNIIKSTGQYIVKNNGTDDVSMSSNYWAGLNSNTLDSKIYDYYDDFEKGKVTYNPNPTLNSEPPISPVSNVKKSISGNTITINWDVNREPDLAGYKVYYGSLEDLSYTSVTDVSNQTSLTLTLSDADTEIAVTAYDTDADGTKDQLEGHESWYSKAISGSISKTLILVSDNNNTDLTNCDDIKFTATFNTDVSSPVILQITDSSTTTYQLGMTPVTSTASSSVASDSTFTTWEANWSATASYSLGSLTMTVSHTGAQVISTTNTSTIAKLEFNLTDNAAVCGVSSPTVTLTDTDSDNNVSNSDVVTITATFSESMAATPTISLTGIVSDAAMSATASDSVWTYTWTVSGSTVTSTTATVSGTDLSGNTYAGTDSITFTIDNSNPTLISFTDNDTDNIVNNSTNVTFSATFSESMAASPTLSLSGLVTNTAMTVSSSTNSTTWTYFWDVPSGSDGTYFATVSGTDLLGNVYSGTESITFIIDNTNPLIQSVTVTDTNSKVLLTYNEPVQLYDPSYSVSNFSVTETGGTATVSYTGYSFSTTDSNTIILNITVTGEPTGDELLEVGPAGASTLIDKAGNYAMDYSDSSQTSNTVYLTNTPPKFASTSVSSNNTSITIAFSEGVTADASGAELSKTDFTLAVSGGLAVLASATPIALSKTDSKTYVLSTSYSVPSNGSEILTVTPISSAVFDSKGTQINLTAAQSNTVQLNDQAGPSITGAALDSQNRYVDITFSEGIYSTASPTSAVTSSSFTLSQRSGPSYGMTISNITTAAGGALSGGETTLRFNLGSTVKPTGQEVFAITATDSSSVVDVSGNSMTASQTNNTFQLKPPTSGGVSPEKSTISAAPAEMIGNGINTAVITVQSKDSLGQNFFEGGYQVTLFSPQGDLPTTDNQNGTYTATYIPVVPSSDSVDISFGFRVIDVNGASTALLTIHRDDDGDGVFNSLDQCPNTEAGLVVDATGCALNQLDDDNDGVTDDIDECPDTPEFELNNVKGTPTFGQQIPTVVDGKGCGASQRDTDGDGVFDTEDNCIDTANSDQADKDGDGIGDVCDTDNPLPEITTTEIRFVQLPPNGSTIGKIDATDIDGETLTFTQTGSNFTGVLSVGVDGTVTVSLGTLLSFDSTYNGALLSFTVSDGENEVPGSVTIVIEDAPRPPEIAIITFEVSEDAQIGTLVGLVVVKDPMGGQIESINFSGDGYLEFVGGELRTTKELDYETLTAHPFTITATAASSQQGASGLTGSKTESVRVTDIPNTTYTGRFFISIFKVADKTLGAKVGFRRFFNPHNKGVGKWKVKKRISGGADANKFTVKTRSKTEQKNDDPIEDENEDYLEFITPPDYENPGDANGDNIYEVEVEYVNTTDGAPEVPISVTQTNIQVPEGKVTAIELQSQPVLPTDDNDGDGIVDIFDNSPLVSNPDQSDEDGDGVGDVTDDADQDGVWNPFDTCPDTPLGELVDLDGCLIYYLPANNFSIYKTEKCAGENSINLSVVDATVTYNVSVSGATSVSENFTGSSWSLDELSAGVYNVCVSVEGVNPLEFERCFEVTIQETDPLLVSSFYDRLDQVVSFDLSGGSTYQVTHNGKTTQTSSSKYTVSLNKGINNISISTGIECQGLFENSYLNSYEVKYAPNPFKEQLQLYIGGQDNIIEIGVYSLNGQLVEYQTISLPFGVRNYILQTANYKQGSYIIKVKGDTLDQSIQVIKK